MRLQNFCVLNVLVLAFGWADARGGTLEIENTTFGWDPKAGTIPTGGTSTQAMFPAVAVNQPIEIEFDQTLSKKSADSTTVLVTTLGPTVLVPLGLSSTLPGGQSAPVQVKVNGNRVTILPAVLASGNTIAFGFVAGAYYQLELRGKKQGIKGNSGDTLKKSVFINFRAEDLVADWKQGAPKPSVKLIDAAKGAVTLKKTSLQDPKPSFTKAVPNPAPAIRIRFNELVLPSSVLNPASGASENIRIELDQDNDGTTNDRTNVPGTFAISHSNFKSTVEWTPKLESVPPDQLYIVTILPFIKDLVGNQLADEDDEGVGALRLFAYRTKPADVQPLDPIIENFSGVVNRDADATSADWAGTVGFLKNGAGGGTGADGLFDPTANMILPTGVFDMDLGIEVQKTWNFTTFEIDSGITVRAMGSFPLVIRCTGLVSVKGKLDVSGAAGSVFSEKQIPPGLGGAGEFGGEAGGNGGSITDGFTLDAPLFVTVPGYKAGEFANQGLSGRSSSVSDFSVALEGNELALNSSFVGLWIQPNTGTGSSVPSATPGNFIFHNHPTFSIDSVVPSKTANVVSDSMDPLFAGPLTQAGLDLYEIPPPPIVKVGDPVILGDLAGHAGQSVGFEGTGGLGSLPLTVAQQFNTEVRSGGGGGGGSRLPGSAGEDSPASGLNSESTGTAGAAGGAGSLTVPTESKTATVLNVTGTPLDGLDLSGFLVFPNVDAGHLFEIESNTGSSITILPVQLPNATGADTDSSGVLDLDDVALGTQCRIEPNLGVGGSGGGGSGVHLAGTLKFGGPPNLTLPSWTPGAGGGAGGGAVSIESAKGVSVLLGGEISARGGAGGRTNGSIGSSASGGGGGGGGAVRLASADPSALAVRIQGLVDATGGSGGIGAVDGGPGGDGRVRFESLNGNLVSTSYPIEVVKPAVLPTDLGYFIPGLAPSVGQSLFYNTKSLAASYTSFRVTYNATVNGVPQTGLIYTYADLKNGIEAPFTLTLNDALLSSTGVIDPATIDNDFVTDLSLLSGPFIRFRFVLHTEIEVTGDVYTDIAIDQILIEVAG